MSNFHEVLIGLITALIGYIVGWLGKAVTDRRRYHRARGLWRTLVGPDITIVVGQHELTEWEASDLIGVGDAQALSELQRFLDRIGVSQPRIAYGSRMEGEARRNDMILIGGPDCNRVTHEVMLRSEGTLRFVDPQHNIVSIQDASGDTVYNPSVEGGEGTDYGLLIRVAN